MSRKDPTNFGGTLANEKDDANPTLAYEEAAGRYSIVMAERVFTHLLKLESDRLSAPGGEADLRRFFAHFFDPMITEDERESYVKSFQKTPPRIVLGYPRSGAEFPCIAVVLESDQSDQEALGRYMGQTRPDDPAERAVEYIGSMYDQTYAAYVYATHPDMCLYLYHFAKAVFAGSDEVLGQCGIIDPIYNGQEMAPDQAYLPENMFVRRLGIQFKSLHTVPKILGVDPARVRLVGLHADDIVVGGFRGGVHPIDPAAGE